MILVVSLEPPLPVYLFNVVAGLKDKSAKGYPVKKVRSSPFVSHTYVKPHSQLLLVLWKSILTCCGGIRELTRVKKLSRELAGLPPIPDESTMRCVLPNPSTDIILAIAIKASPLDIEAFRQEISVKYPTFTPPPPPQQVASCTPTPTQTIKLAQAYSPIPVRHHYDRDGGDNQHQGMSVSSQQMQYTQQGGSGYRGMPQPATPAPTPPPSPKPKKQQFQTDQTRPFLFPFARSKLGQRDARLVPFAIDEADKLYNKHMYVSVSLWQMWRTREECMTTESGLAYMPGSERVEEPKIAPPVSFSPYRKTDIGHECLCIPGRRYFRDASGYCFT